MRGPGGFPWFDQIGIAWRKWLGMRVKIIDEYNRIPTRTQSALLTVMSDNYAELYDQVFECPESAWYLTANDDEFTAKDVFDLAAQGDRLAVKLVDDTAYYLALGASAAIAAVDPKMIVYGGGMTAAGEQFLTLIRENVGRFALPYPAKSVEVRFAELGSDAGFIGAAGCARQLARRVG